MVNFPQSDEAGKNGEEEDDKRNVMRKIEMTMDQ